MAEAHTRLRGRRLIYAVLAGAAGAALLLVLGLVAPQRFASLGDLGLLTRLVTAHARWDLPALATRSFTLTMEHEALAGAAVALVAVLALALPFGIAALTRRHVLARATGFAQRLVVDRSPSERVTAWAFVVLALVIGLPWLDVADPQGLAFRLRIAAFVPLAMCGAVAAASLAPLLPRQRTAALAAVAVVIALRGSHERTEGRVLAHPALVAAAMAATDQIPSNATVVVPERHIAFMVAWYSRKPVSLRPEAVPYARRVRLLPLAFTIAGSPLEQAIDAARTTPGVEPPIGLHPRHRNGLVLVTEPTWDWMLARLPERDRRHFARWPTI